MFIRALEKRIRYIMKAGCTCIGDEEFAKRWMADTENWIMRWLDATHSGDSTVFCGVTKKYRMQFQRYRSRPWFKVFERNVKCFRLDGYTGPEGERTREEIADESAITEINRMRSAAAEKAAEILRVTGFTQSSVSQGLLEPIDEGVGFRKTKLGETPRSRVRASRLRFIGVPRARWSSQIDSEIQNLQPQKGYMYIGSTQSIREWEEKHSVRGKLTHTSSTG
ncbi:hypothetical protein NM688_g5591 [Phlebia brevispora]|uniref:Uncharacterized protein n=1 Tax=Phlebia brevispora TaxID=194682 RepID=A0ACC1SSW7_9APHY|nr:hypothetical protein NM688_g5591 [Phlebia brevispora]